MGMRIPSASSYKAKIYKNEGTLCCRNAPCKAKFGNTYVVINLTTYPKEYPGIHPSCFQTNQILRKMKIKLRLPPTALLSTVNIEITYTLNFFHHITNIYDREYSLSSFGLCNTLYEVPHFFF
jgi:hypothetical protein